MRFCTKCDNMLYLIGGNPNQDKEKNTILLQCHFCNNTETLDSQQSIPISTKKYTTDATKNNADDKTVMKVDYFDDIRSYNQFHTDNIKYDVTLPRVNNIKCPNDCEEKLQHSPEIISMRYDKKNMKFKYYCVNCRTFWTGSS